MVTLVNSGLNTRFQTTTSAQGLYSFPALSVGHYDVTFESPGFKPQKKTNVTIDADAAVRVDAGPSGRTTVGRGDGFGNLGGGHNAGGNRRDAPGRSGIGRANRVAAPQRPQLYGSAGNSARRQPDHYSHANFRDHGRRHRERSIRRAI